MLDSLVSRMGSSHYPTRMVSFMENDMKNIMQAAHSTKGPEPVVSQCFKHFSTVPGVDFLGSRYSLAQRQQKSKTVQVGVCQKFVIALCLR